MIDRSQSQTLADRPARTTAAVTALRTRLADMEDMLVREITVAPRTASAGATAATAGDGTRLLAPWPRALAEIRAAAWPASWWSAMDRSMTAAGAGRRGAASCVVDRSARRA